MDLHGTPIFHEAKSEIQQGYMSQATFGCGGFGVDREGHGI
jgi:hypothetical protein